MKKLRGEGGLPSASLFQGDNCSTYNSLQIGSFNIRGRPMDIRTWLQEK